MVKHCKQVCSFKITSQKFTSGEIRIQGKRGAGGLSRLREASGVGGGPMGKEAGSMLV